MIKNYELIIIGGGPAGLGAAVEARSNGIEDILIIDRERFLGGILTQCIHPGFGLHIFKKELTGPEYAQEFISKLENQKIDHLTDTMAVDITKNKTVRILNPLIGPVEIKTKALILAMGCRERTRGALNIPGSRPSGIFTAGTAQRFINIDGYMPGRSVVILGSGDIGLIMARRMTLEGADVKMVCELLDYPGGLTRNIVQCLDDFDIPLMLGHTVSKIHGSSRLTGLSITNGDKEFFVECDTLLLSVGLIPENELSKKVGVQIDPATLGPVVNEAMQTGIDWIFTCGNVLQVHDLVDNVTLEAAQAGRNAALYIKNNLTSDTAESVRMTAGDGIRYVLPQRICFIEQDKPLSISYRVMRPYEDISVVLRSGSLVIHEVKKDILTPGEAEKMILPPVVLEKMRNKKDLTLSIRKR